MTTRCARSPRQWRSNLPSRCSYWTTDRATVPPTPSARSFPTFGSSDACARRASWSAETRQRSWRALRSSSQWTTTRSSRRNGSSRPPFRSSTTRGWASWQCHTSTCHRERGCCSGHLVKTASSSRTASVGQRTRSGASPSSQLGGYRELLFQQAEEADFAIRLLDAGQVVRLGRADPVRHFASPKRDVERMWFYECRNEVLFAWHNVPMPDLLVQLGKTVLYMLWLGRGVRRTGLFARGLLSGFRDALRHPSRRSSVRRDTWRLYSRLAKGPARIEAISTA